MSDNNKETSSGKKNGFQLTKEHLQGAVAMLTLVAFVITSMYFIPGGRSLLGTLFEGTDEVIISGEDIDGEDLLPDEQGNIDTQPDDIDTENELSEEQESSNVIDSLIHVPTALQMTRLFEATGGEQLLNIFMDYDAFSEDINISMLSFSGVIDASMVNEVIYLEPKMIRLTITGPLQAGDAEILFDAQAVTSGNDGRVAYITVNTPICTTEGFVEYWYVSKDDMTFFALDLDGISDISNGGLNVTFDGVLSSMTVVDVSAHPGQIIVAATGSAGTGPAIINIGGLHQAQAIFDFAPGEATLWEPGPDSVDMRGIAIMTVLTAAGYIAMAIDTALWLGTMIHDITHEIGGMEPNLYYLLEDISELNKDVRNYQREVIERFDRLDFQLSQELIKKDYELVKGTYDEFYSYYVSGLGSGDTEWKDNNLLYTGNTLNNRATEYIWALNRLIKALDPDAPSSLSIESILSVFAKTSKSNLPFAHNIYDATVAYYYSWDMELANYMILAAEINDYTFKHEETHGFDSPGLFSALTSQMRKMSYGYQNLNRNFKKFITESSFGIAHAEFVDDYYGPVTPP